MRTLLAGASALVLAAAASGASVAQTRSDSATVSEVIVTAQPDPDDPPVVAEARERLSRTPGAVAVVAAESYDDRLATGFFDTLRNVPGVITGKRYGEETRLSIRGSGVGQAFHQRGVLLAQDGVPFADADGFSDFQGVDPLTARFIEVYKGGNALRFGGAQLGGAVNLVSITGRTARTPNLLRLEGGSFGTVRGQASLAREAGDWDVYANVDGLTADGYRNQSQQSQLRATLNVGRRFGEDREVRLISYGLDVQQEVPGALTLAQALNAPKTAPASNVINDNARDQAVLRNTLQTRWRFSDALVFEGAVYGTTKSLYHPIFQVVDQEIQTQGAFGRFDWTGQVGGLSADLFAGAAYRTGDLKARQFVNVGGNRGAQTADALQEASGLDLFTEGRLFFTERLAVVGGATWGRATRDYVRYPLAGGAPPFANSRDFEWLAPRVGLLWQDADGRQVYANLTRSVEPPTYGALVQGASPAFVPVEEQKAWTGEVGARGRAGPFTYDAAVFRSELEGELLNFIVGPDIPAATFNAGDTVHQGVEAALDWRLLEDRAPGGGALLLRQTYTYSDFRFDGDRRYRDNRLPLIPEHQYRAELTYSHPAGWSLTPAVEWRPKDVWIDYANTAKAPGYTLLSLNAAWTAATGVTLFLDARNLTDERHVAEFGAVTDARTAATNVFYPGEGRSAFVGVSYAF